MFVCTKRSVGSKTKSIIKTIYMKTFKYTSDKMDLKTLKRKRLDIFDNFIFGKITYDQYVEQGKRLEEAYG